MAEILVSDGAVAWVADLATLRDALNAQGWQRAEIRGEAVRLEPEAGPDDDPGEAYRALCEAVPMVRDLADDDHDRLPWFYWRPELQETAWQFGAAGGV